MIKRLFFAMVLSTIATTASATLYTCAVREDGKLHGWIPQRVLIGFHENGEIFVKDSLGVSVFGTDFLAPAALINESDKIYFIRWNVDGGLSITSQFTRMTFTATIDKRSGSIRMRGKPEGFSNFYRGAGKCTAGPLPS